MNETASQSNPNRSCDLDRNPSSEAGRTCGDHEQDWSSLQASLELSGAAREFARNLQLESVDENRWRFLVPDTLRTWVLKVWSEPAIGLVRTLGHAVMLDLHTASEPVKSVAAAPSC